MKALSQTHSTDTIFRDSLEHRKSEFITSVLSDYILRKVDSCSDDEREDLFIYLSKDNISEEGILKELAKVFPSVESVETREKKDAQFAKNLDAFFDDSDNFEIDDFYTTKELEVLFNISRSTIQKFKAENKIVFVSFEGKKTHYFPKWQFSKKHIIEGISEVLQILKVNGSEAIAIFKAKREFYSGKSIIELLQSNDIRSAMNLAYMELEYLKQAQTNNQDTVFDLFDTEDFNLADSFNGES